jgi:hypothetical protein
MTANNDPASILNMPSAPRTGAALLEKFDRSVKPSRPISAYRDARFMRDLEAFIAHTELSPLASTSVCNALPLSPSVSSASYPPKALEKSANAVPTMPPPNPSEAPARVRSKVAPWWHGHYFNEPVRRHRHPAQWRDTSDILRCQYAHEAILRLGQVHTFTLRLRDDMEAKARAQSNPIAWLQKRIDRELSNALDRPVQFILTIEEDDKRRLHCHGEFQVDQQEVKAARAALRKAGGVWKNTRQHQAKTEADPDYGWTGYISKDFWMTTPMMRRLMAPYKTKYKVTFPGSPLSITADLNAEAKLLYGKHRALVIN